MGLTTAKLKDLQDKNFDKLYEKHAAVWTEMSNNARDFVLRAVAENNIYQPEDLLEPLEAAVRANQMFRDHQADNFARSSRFVTFFAEYIIYKNVEGANEQSRKTASGEGVH